MTCGPLEIVDGGLLNQPRIVDPEITGGSAQALTLVQPALSGGLSIDQAAAESLGDAVRPLFEIPAYKDCHNAAIPLNGKVATCAELESAVAEATDPARVAAVFKRKDGTDMGAGAKLMTVDEVGEAIAQALCEAGVGDDMGTSIASLAWDSATKTLTVTEVKDVILQTPRTVVLSGLLSVPAGVWPSAPAPEGFLPMSVFGGRTALLGTPTKFLKVEFEGIAGWIPFYQGG